MSLTRFYIIACRIVIVLLLCTSCQKENSQLETGDPITSEQAYFEDYQKPKHKWGYLDRSGKLVISGSYDDCRDFSDGLAVANQSGKWGYIDKSGDFAIAPEYRSAWDFVDGTAKVRRFDDSYALIDKQGKMIWQSETLEPYQPRESILRTRQESVYGLSKMDGTEVLAPRYLALGDVVSSTAFAKMITGYGIIDLQGENLVPFEYDRIQQAASGKYLLSKSGNKYFYDIKSATISEPFRKATGFQGDRAAVYDGKTWKLIDENLSDVASIDADRVRAGGEGMWIIHQDQKLYLHDNDGKRISDRSFDMLGRFNEKRATAAQGDAWGLIDTNGEYVEPPLYPLAWDYSEGLARVINRAGISYIDTAGNHAFSTKYFEARDFHEGLARVQLKKGF